MQRSSFCRRQRFLRNRQRRTIHRKPIQQRKENQQDRIGQGVQSGQLTAGETKNLETKEAGLNKEERTMRSEDDGHLTSADRSKLNNQQNHLSNQIYDDKHNGAGAAQRRRRRSASAKRTSRTASPRE